MKHLFKDWKKIKDFIKKRKRVILLADYDGTLTRIVSNPKKALLNKRVRRLLKTLSRKKDFSVGIVSGRALKDVRCLVGLKGIYYAGNHGLEIKGPGISFMHSSCKKFKPCLTSLKKELASKTGSIKNAIIEDKGLSISLHYRNVRKKDVGRLERIFKKITAPYVKQRKIKISSGKKVLEIRPPASWNKGNAAARILKKVKQVFPIYLGDDVTDEDAFRALKMQRSVTVFVGKKKKTAAAYYLESPKQVENLLKRLCRI